jgi:four helix bundle protein
LRIAAEFLSRNRGNPGQENGGDDGAPRRTDSMTTTGFMGMQVWKEAHAAVLTVHALTRSFPDTERYGLAGQMRRAAVSIPANIAEGFGRRRSSDKARFYNIAQSSAEELKYYLILSKDLGYLKEQRALWSSLETIGRRLYRLIESMESKW